MAAEKTVIQRYTRRYRFFYYVPRYGKLYKFLRVVIALGALGYALVLVDPAIPEGSFLWFVVGIAALAGAALAFTGLIHGLNALLEKILWSWVTIRAEMGDRFTYEDDGARLHDFALRDITNIRSVPVDEEKPQQGGRSIKKLLRCEHLSIVYTQNGRQKTCDLSDFPDEEIAKLVKALEKRGVDFAADRAYKESRWVFGTTRDRTVGGKQENMEFDLLCEIYENGDMRFVATQENNFLPAFRAGSEMTTVHLHDYKRFYDASHETERGNWSRSLLMVDQDGQEHRLWWGFGGGFDKWKERIAKLTGKSIEDISTSDYVPRSWRDEDEEIDYGPSSEEIKRRKEELNSQMTATMLSASLEMERLEALGMDETVTAKLIGMEAGFAISEVYDLHQQKKNL